MDEYCLFDSPQGYIGLAGNIQRPVPFKLYVSHLSANYIETQYQAYVQRIGMETLIINPKSAKLQDIFLKRQVF